MSGSDLFVSHSSRDKDVVKRICAVLSASGLNVWVDINKEMGIGDGLTAGDHWPMVIQEAVDNCRTGLFIMSPASAMSKYCTAEWEQIRSAGKPLFVAQIVSDMGGVPVPLMLRTIQTVQLLPQNFDRVMPQLVEAIQASLKIWSPPKPQPDYREQQVTDALIAGNTARARELLQEAPVPDAPYYLLLAGLRERFPVTMDQMDALERSLIGLCKSADSPAHYFYLYAWVKQRWYHELHPQYREPQPALDYLIRRAETATLNTDKLQTLLKLVTIDGITGQSAHRRLRG